MTNLSAKTKKTKKTTFFSLPRELRDLVYEFACEGVEVAPFKSTRTSPRVPGHLHEHDNEPKTSNSNIAILQVCSRIRFEAQPIYWHQTTFTFTAISDCAHWIKLRVPEHLQYKLSNVRLENSWSKSLSEDMKERVAAKTCILLDFSLANALRGTGQEAISDVKKLLRWGPSHRLSKSALWVKVFDKDFNFVWTATPAKVELPSPERFANA